MPAKIFSEEEVGDKVQLEILAEFGNLCKKTKNVPGLAVIVVGEDPASLSAAQKKEEVGKELGFRVGLHRLPATVSTEEVCKVIRRLNSEEQLHGLFCQLPLPRHLPEKDIIAAIDPGKDVGGTHPLNAGRLWGGMDCYLPCSADGCLQALNLTGQSLQGKTAVLLGHSNIVTKPLALVLLQKNATVTVCPTITGELPGICRSADILITEMGKPGLVKGDWVKPGAVVIGAAATRSGEVSMGDVVSGEVVQVAGWFFHLPARETGVLMPLMLMKNTLKAFQKIII